MRNVVVVCLDSVRKDYFDAHAKRLRALSDISWDHCRAASSWSIPSHASMLTGELPSTHGVHTHNLDFSTLDATNVLTQTLDSHYRMSVSANEFTSGRFGFDEWFDECLTIGPTKRLPLGLDTRASQGMIDHLRKSIHHEYPLRSVANGFFSKLTSITDDWPVPGLFDHGASAIIRASRRRINQCSEPFFLFTNFMDAHLPHRNLLVYDANVPYKWTSTNFDHWEINIGGKHVINARRKDVEYFRSIYAAAIRYLDKRVSTFIQTMQEATDQKMIFIITADHGENLGYESDNWLFGHTSSLSEGLLHVPLEIIGGEGSNIKTDDSPVSHLQFPELVLSTANKTNFDIIRNHIPAEVVGGGLLDDLENNEFWDRAIRALYDKDREEKCVWDSLGQVNWYEVDDTTPSEESPITENRGIPSQAESIFDMEISKYKQQAQSDEEQSLERNTRGRLEDLGYL